jgi:predicted permease
MRTFPWLDALRFDLTYAWRQLIRHRTASAAAILSLGLAIGATTGAFRLLDAVVLRTLPVAEPERLFMVTLNRPGASDPSGYRDDFDYREFREYSAVIRDTADSLLVGLAARIPVTFSSPDETERVYRQYVSGNVFPAFRLVPALGRLLSPADDVTPGGHAVAVVSYDYWTRRFARDPAIVGRTFLAGGRRYQIIGVAPRGFTGTEPGRLTDVFIPSQMNVAALNSPGWSWFRLWVRPKDGIAPEQVRQALQGTLTRNLVERARTLPADTPADQLNAFLHEQVGLVPAGGGTSGLQRTLRQPLFVLMGLGILVLLIACASVANLLATRASSRGREFALRVSIGSQRSRLVQLVLVESALLAALASVAGMTFAEWSTPFVVSLFAPPDDPVRLVLDLEAGTMAFAAALTFAVAGALGLVPALRASGVSPLGAIRRDDDRVSPRRVTGALVASQMAFSVFVLFVATLFGATFTRLANRSTGFSDRNVLVLETLARGHAGTPAAWAGVAATLRGLPGVEAATASGWAPLTDNRWRGAVRIGDRRVETFFLDVSSGFFATLGIGQASGRDFRAGDVPPGLDAAGRARAGMGIVNDAFARAFFDGNDPVGRTVTLRQDGDVDAPMTIVGLVHDAMYRSVRDPIRPIVYVPMTDRDNGAVIVRTAGDPLALAATIRSGVRLANADFRVSDIGLQRGLFRRQIVRERLLATLSLFFAAVGLLVAAVGLYGVLHAAVDQRQREIGIRLALGAGAWHIVRRVTLAMLGLAGLGAAIGLAGGVTFGRLIDALLFRVTPTDAFAIATPIAILAAAAVLAALPPVLRATRMDPVRILRSE